MNHLDLYGMHEEERRTRQGFLGITAEDSSNVRALRNVFADYSRQFAERFYDRLLANPHTAALLQDAKQLELLKGLQARYFAELLEGIYDKAYFEGRLRVGVAHQRIGLEPEWYLGAYNQYIQLTFPLFAKAFGDNLEKALPILLSLIKVIFLDIGLALRTYFQRATDDCAVLMKNYKKPWASTGKLNVVRNNFARCSAMKCAAASAPLSLA
jgi:hypothetical protein